MQFFDDVRGYYGTDSGQYININYNCVGTENHLSFPVSSNYYMNNASLDFIRKYLYSKGIKSIPHE